VKLGILNLIRNISEFNLHLIVWRKTSHIEQLIG